MNYGGGYPRNTYTSTSTTSTTTSNQYTVSKVPSRPKVRLRVSYNLQQHHQHTDPVQQHHQHTDSVQQQVQHQRHCFGVNSLAINEDSGHLYSAGRDATIRCWDINKLPLPEHLSCFEHHTDWINDIFLCNNNNTLVSCSSDASIKIWDTKTAQCSRTLNRHGDYVKALSYASQADMFASAGLDTNIFIWDLQQCTAPVVSLTGPASPSLSCASGFRNNVAPVVRTGVEKGSLYSLAMNATANIVLSGSTEMLVRAWDPRSGQKVFKLKGHTDNIKALAVNDAGTLCISGSSDFTLRLWDLRQQQCIHVFEVHDDSIWSIAVDPTFSNVYSGGRDGSVFVTDLVTSNSTHICTESHPILKIQHSKRDDSLWITTTDSCVKNWGLENNVSQPQRRVYTPPPTLSSSPTTSSFQGSKSTPVVSAARATILGKPGMIKHHILNNRRHVLTKDSSGVVALWDITQGKQLESFGVVSFEQKLEALTEIISVANWFSADTKTGSLTVHLDFPQCLSAEVYAGDVFEDLPPEDEEIQMNLGQSVLRSLFSYWEEGRRALDTHQKHEPKSQFQLPYANHTNHLQHSNHVQPNGRPLDRKSSEHNTLKEDGAATTTNEKPATLNSSTSNLLSRSSSHTNSTLASSSTLPNNALSNSTQLKNSSYSTTNPSSTTAANTEERPTLRLPMLNLLPEVSVIISEEGTGATMHRATRSQFVGDEPPEIIPPWVVDCLIHHEIPQSTLRALTTKLGFFLYSADEKELPQLPQQGNTQRLSANRLLRVRKVANYVVQKLELELPLIAETKTDAQTPTPTPTDDKTDPEAGGSDDGEDSDNGKLEERVSPEHYIDIICNNKVLAPQYSLATVKTFFWKSGEENIVFHYKLNAKYASTDVGEKHSSLKKGSKGNNSNSSKKQTSKRSLLGRKM